MTGSQGNGVTSSAGTRRAQLRQLAMVIRSGAAQGHGFLRTVSPQNPHKYGSALTSPTKKLRIMRHFLAQSGTDAKVVADADGSHYSPLCR
jgi:hypothetical protein